MARTGQAPQDLGSLDVLVLAGFACYGGLHLQETFWVPSQLLCEAALIFRTAINFSEFYQASFLNNVTLRIATKFMNHGRR
jgi:hypothetical protein